MCHLVNLGESPEEVVNVVTGLVLVRHSRLKSGVVLRMSRWWDDDDDEVDGKCKLERTTRLLSGHPSRSCISWAMSTGIPLPRSRKRCDEQEALGLGKCLVTYQMVSGDTEDWYMACHMLPSEIREI